KDGYLKCFPLSQYVVKRDLEGNVLEILTKESLSRHSLPKKIADALEEKGAADDGKSDGDIALYTHVKREESGSWTVYQEACGHKIEGTSGTFAKGRSPWIPLRW